MNLTGAPAHCWLLCMLYVCHLLNATASPALGGLTPLQALTGQVPDISHFLHFSFWEPIYYKVDESEPDHRFSSQSDRIPSTTPGAEPPRDARDSGSARSHSTHLETSSPDRPKMVTYTESQTVSSYMSVKCTRRTLRMPKVTRATHAQPSLSDFPWRDSEFWRADPLTQDDPGGTKFSHFPPK